MAVKPQQGRAQEGRGLVRLWLGMCRAHRRGRLGRAWAQLIRRYIHLRYACHISPESRPEGWINLPHPVGVVVGHGVEIGVEATLYAGCVVVGPHRVGRDAVVGANAVVLGDVPDGAVAVGAPARILPRRERGDGAAGPA